MKQLSKLISGMTLEILQMPQIENLLHGAETLFISNIKLGSETSEFWSGHWI